jgi:hypothetical protein
LKISPLEKRSSKIGTQREGGSLPFTGERPCRRSGHPAAPSTAPPVGDLSTGVAKPCVPRGAAGQTSSGRPSCRRTATWWSSSGAVSWGGGGGGRPRRSHCDSRGARRPRRFDPRVTAGQQGHNPLAPFSFRVDSLRSVGWNEGRSDLVN